MLPSGRNRAVLLVLLACAPAVEGDSVAPPPARVAAAPKDDDGVGCAAAPAVTWESWGQGFFRTWCGACHSAGAQDRHGAPDGLDFDTRAQLLDQLDRVRVRVLDEATMPLGGGIPEADRQLLEVLLTCGP